MAEPVLDLQLNSQEMELAKKVGDLLDGASTELPKPPPPAPAAAEAEPKSVKQLEAELEYAKKEFGSVAARAWLKYVFPKLHALRLRSDEGPQSFAAWEEVLVRDERGLWQSVEGQLQLEYSNVNVQFQSNHGHRLALSINEHADKFDERVVKRYERVVKRRKEQSKESRVRAALQKRKKRALAALEEIEELERKRHKQTRQQQEEATEGGSDADSESSSVLDD